MNLSSPWHCLRISRAYDALVRYTVEIKIIDSVNNDIMTFEPLIDG